MNENKMVVPVIDEEKAIVADMQNATSVMYSSFSAESVDDKKRLYNATSTNTGTIKDMLNKELIVNDVIVTAANVVDEATGEVSTVPRSVLITADGSTYTASSWGVYRSLQKLNALFGGLHFEDGLTVVPKEVKTKKGYTLTLELV